MIWQYIGWFENDTLYLASVGILVDRQGRTSEIPQAYLYDTPRIARAENAADGQKGPPDVKRS